MKEAIRYAFLKDWVHEASTEEIIEKLIENDERAKKIKKLEKTIDSIEKFASSKDNWWVDVGVGHVPYIRVAKLLDKITKLKGQNNVQNND